MSLRSAMELNFPLVGHAAVHGCGRGGRRGRGCRLRCGSACSLVDIGHPEQIVVFRPLLGRIGVPDHRSWKFCRSRHAPGGICPEQLVSPSGGRSVTPARGGRGSLPSVVCQAKGDGCRRSEDGSIMAGYAHSAGAVCRFPALCPLRAPPGLAAWRSLGREAGGWRWGCDGPRTVE